MHLHAGYSSSQPRLSREDALSCQAIWSCICEIPRECWWQQLFIHWNRSIRDIMRSHIIKEAYAYTRADIDYDQVTTHEVRALSASCAYNCQVTLPGGILSAAFWRSSGIFQNSYLWDMACIADGMSTLDPVVVAQVMDPGHLPPP